MELLRNFLKQSRKAQQDTERENAQFDIDRVKRTIAEWHAALRQLEAFAILEKTTASHILRVLGWSYYCDIFDPVSSSNNVIVVLNAFIQQEEAQLDNSRKGCKGGARPLLMPFILPYLRIIYFRTNQLYEVQRLFV